MTDTLDPRDQFTIIRHLSVLGGVARLTISQSSKILSAKSLYGAGTTRYSSTYVLELAKKATAEGTLPPQHAITVDKSSMSEKQNIIRAKTFAIVNDTEREAAITYQCERFIEKRLLNGIFEDKDNIDELERQASRY